MSEGKREKRGSIAANGLERKNGMYDPYRQTLKQLRGSMCDEGPEGCAECGICRFGTEYVRRLKGGSAGNGIVAGVPSSEREADIREI